MQPAYKMSNPQEAYRKQGVLTASPLELIIMLYDGCRKKLMLAQRAIAKNEVEVAHTHMIRSQDIISELINCLDLSLPLSKELFELYEFMIHAITQANISKDAQALDPILEMLGTLRDTWREVSEMPRDVAALQEDGEDEDG